MPVTKIEVKRSWPAQSQQQIIDIVHAAMVESLKIPVGDKLIRFVEHRPDQFVTPPGTTENYTLVEITLLPGRSLQAKRSLYKDIVTRLDAIGIAPADVRIILYEVQPDNWGIRGGIPASEVDLGIK